MNVAEIMTPDPVTVSSAETVLDAVQLMIARRVSALPVLGEDDRLVGILTEGDLLRRHEIGTEHKYADASHFLIPGHLALEYVRGHTRRVVDLMSSPVVTADEAMPLDGLVKLMEQHRIKCVPILRAGKLIAMVSRADLLKAIARLAGSAAPDSEDDRAIRAQIQEALGGERWAPQAVRFFVSNGAVELQGTIVDERLRTALRVLVENVPGVKEVQDKMVWANPMAGVPAGDRLSPFKQLVPDTGSVET